MTYYNTQITPFMDAKAFNLLFIKKCRHYQLAEVFFDFLLYILLVLFELCIVFPHCLFDFFDDLTFTPSIPDNYPTVE